ncbi:MAG: hypothetical protein HWE25_11960 [Alphaproteobacteria bacterium]|nr:hypothetical protein [Alphaproteobacteria bacterium]
MPMIPRLFAVLSALVLAACDPIAQVPASPPAVVGTRAVMQYHRQELYSEITGVTGKVVTTEVFYQGRQVAEFGAYRGLYIVNRREPNFQVELDFDESALEALFPLQVGKEVSFSGNTKRLDRGTSYNFWSNVQVVGEKTMKLASGDRQVFVVDILTETEGDGRTMRKTQTVYFDPELSMILKSVLHEDGYKNYWFVVKVEKPSEGKGQATQPQLRSSTVII